MSAPATSVASAAARRVVAATGLGPSAANVGISWPGSGTMVFWQLGVLRGLSRHADPASLPMLGSSSGAFVTALAACGVDPTAAAERLLASLVAAERSGRRLGLMGALGGITRAWVDECLPHNAGALCSRRSTLLVTRLPLLRTQRVSAFASKQDVVDAVLASSHLPLLLDGRLSARFRAARVIDGGFWWWWGRCEEAYREGPVRGRLPARGLEEEEEEEEGEGIMPGLEGAPAAWHQEAPLPQPCLPRVSPSPWLHPAPSQPQAPQQPTVASPLWPGALALQTGGGPSIAHVAALGVRGLAAATTTAGGGDYDAAATAGTSGGGGGGGGGGRRCRMVLATPLRDPALLAEWARFRRWRGDDPGAAAAMLAAGEAYGGGALLALLAEAAGEGLAGT